MALKAVVKSLDEVPTELQGLYKEIDGVFVLDLSEDEIREHPGAKSLKNALDSERERGKKDRDKIRELQATFEKFKDIDPDKARQALDTIHAIEEKKLIEEDKIDELVERRLERNKQDYEQKINVITGQANEYKSNWEKTQLQLEDVVITNAITKASVEKQARKTAIADIINRAKPIWKFKDGELIALKNGTEEALYGKDGAPMTPEEWVEQLFTEAPHLAEESRGGGAAGNQPGTVRQGDRLVDLSQPNAIGRNLDAFAEGAVRSVIRR